MIKKLVLISILILALSYTLTYADSSVPMDQDLAFKCTKVYRGSYGNFHILRCENDERICYFTTSINGQFDLQCKFK